MTQPKASQEAAVAPSEKSRVRYLIPLVLLVVVPVTGYFAVDLLKPLIDPCEALFRQTQNSLGTKIELLNIKSELNIKPEKIQELTERAQIVASNLQYCCTTLRGGERRPEDFIQCKTSSSAFELGLDKIAKIKSSVEPGVAEATPEQVPLKEVEQQLYATIEQTNLVSVSFNNQVSALQTEHQFERLEELQHQDLTISNQEAEPNDNLLIPNKMPLNQWIQAEIGKMGESDFYVIRSPATFRDNLLIEFQNKSITVAPQVNVYNGEKALLTKKASSTNGGNLSLQIVVGPEQTFYLQVHEYHNNQTGKYLLKATALKSYDQYEPNQTLLSAKDIDTGQIIEANIMDGGDYDFYRFRTKQDGKLQILFENRSASIAPQMDLFDANKSALHKTANSTNGANLIMQYEVKKDQQYYLRVIEYHTAQAGNYQLIFSYVE